MNKFSILMTTIVFFSCISNSQNQSIAKKNEVVETILARRSIRAYKTEQIKEKQLDTIMKCAINAPSARNYQPWEIRVIQDPEMLKKINLVFNAHALKADPENKKVKENGYSIFYNAPTLIVVAKDKNNQYADFDCGLLTQNVLLSAKSLGIGSVCLGWLAGFLATDDAKDIVNQFNIPDSHEIKIVIGLGYPNEQPDPKTRDAAKIQYFN